MSQLFKSIVLFLFIVFVSVTLTFAVVGLAHADVTFTPTSPQSSGFMGGSSVSVSVTQDGWLSVESPTNGGECYVGFGNAGYNWGTGAIGSVGSGGTLNTYLDGSGAHATDCSPFGITSWADDGDYVFRIYSDETFTTVLESGTFHQGSTTDSVIVEATSTPDQVQQNLWNAYFAFLATVFMVLWLGRRK